MSRNSSLVGMLTYGKPYIAWFILGSFLSIISVVLNIVLPYKLKQLVDLIILGNSQEVFREFVLYIAILLILGTIVVYLRKNVISRFTICTITNIKDSAIRKIQYSNYQSIVKFHSGDLTTRLNSDVDLIKKILTELFEFIYQPLIFITALIFGLMLSWKLTLVTMFILLLAMFFSTLISKPLEKLSIQTLNQYSKCNTIIQDTIKGMDIVKSFNLQKEFKNKFNSEQIETMRIEMNVVKQSLYLMTVITLVMVVPIQVINIYGGRLAFLTDISLGEFTAFLAIINYLTSPITKLISLMSDLKLAIGAANRMQEVLNLPIEENSSENESGKTLQNTLLEFNHVGFSYVDNQTVLKDISFSLKRGQIVAIIGESGGGKSTIIDLICGFIKPKEGEIEVQGENIHEKSMVFLRNHVALVSQDPYIYPMTVEQNIAMSNKIAFSNDIISAAKSAGAHEFIMALSEGYNTLLTENGSNLSGGQKQKISIARALYKNSPILLLDEPTSGLDYESEKSVLDMLRRNVKDKAIIMVTHQLYSMQNIDRILVLNNGTMVEQGNHDELLSRKGYYHKLQKQQNCKPLAKTVEVVSF